SFLCILTPIAPSQTYTLSLHDALPISHCRPAARPRTALPARSSRSPSRVHALSSAADARCPSSAYASREFCGLLASIGREINHRSEEHTSELQSPDHLV